MNGLSRYWPSLLAAHTNLRDRLAELYDEPHRGYHNRKHLLEVLERIDLMLADLRLEAEPDTELDRDAVLLAAWFHDAVYDTGRNTGHDVGADNEEQSATLAARELAAVDAPALLIGEVVRLVRLTKTHQVTGNDLAGQVLCDADLAILAADVQRYGEYTHGVRREYAHVGDENFRKGRARILRELLAMPTLFNTSFAKQHWENLARANVERELIELEA